MRVRSKEATISAEDSFTDYISIGGKGSVDVIDTSSGNMTVTLQKLPYGQSIPIDVDTITAAGVFQFDGDGGQYRVGCKTGDYTSGTFDVVLNGTQSSIVRN